MKPTLARFVYVWLAAWIVDTFLESLVAALAMGLVEILVWSLRKWWRRRRKRKHRNDDEEE
jgi:hypothetical protein